VSRRALSAATKLICHIAVGTQPTIAACEQLHDDLDDPLLYDNIADTERKDGMRKWPH
jgi:hypothetical protein